jgi:hypothetical protein
MSRAVTNGGKAFASASGSLAEIARGAVVNGGVALIGDGIINIAGSSGGHGRLYIAAARPRLHSSPCRMRAAQRFRGLSNRQ